MKERLKLSQCMIVKNEEDNIRHALSWGKKLAWEQIVVDTGSTDRTVDIAKELGAKVFYFPWENDFSSAKNFAIEQAKGNWIAFLDADEYFREEDIPKLKKFLTNMAERPENRHISLIRCTMVHLDDHGKPFSSMEHDRIFRNLPNLRYKNKVHETLSYAEEKKLAWKALGTDIPILHTGYANKALREKNKSQRNITILREELTANPDNYNIWSYLGDSLLAATDWEEAKKAYRKAITGPPDSIFPELAMNSITNLLRVSLEDHSLVLEEWEEIYRQYQNVEGENPDVEYWSGAFLHRCGKWREAAEHIEKAFSILTRASSGLVVYMTGVLDQAYGTLADAYLKQGKKQEAVKNFTLSLKVNAYQPDTLSELLKLFQKAGEETDGVVRFLGRLYDFSKLKDKLYVIREAEKLLYLELSELLKAYLTEEERQWMNLEGAKSETEVRATEDSLKKRHPQIHCNSKTDAHLLSFVNRLENLDSEEILKNLKLTLAAWKVQKPDLVAKLEQFYNDNSFWGGFKMDDSVYTALGNRISLWKEQQDDFLWLYENLADYRSKRVLLAILENWLFLSTEHLAQVKENSFFFYDPDILSLGESMDVLDLMAGKGDYLKLLTEQLGAQHGIIFCCEQRPALLPLLRKRIQDYPQQQIQVYETLKLDIAKLSSVGLVRINAEASTWWVLKEYQELIQRNTPQIAITPYFSYEDLIRIPKWLNKIYPDYRFYLRYFGEDLIPTDYILYAKKP